MVFRKIVQLSDHHFFFSNQENLIVQSTVLSKFNFAQYNIFSEQFYL